MKHYSNIIGSISSRMKRGKTGLKSKLQTLPSQDEKAMNQKWGVSSLPQAPRSGLGRLHCPADLPASVPLVPGLRRCAAAGTASSTPQTCGGDLSLSSVSQLRLTCAPLILTSFSRPSRSTQRTCSMSASRLVISPLCSPPPFSQHSSPVVYTICCRISQGTSAATAPSSLTHYGWRLVIHLWFGLLWI